MINVIDKSNQFQQSLLISFIILFYCINGHSQSSTSGIVVDSLSGEPLPFASVYWKSSKKGVLTDQQGHFTLQREKEDSLVISFIGYETRTIHSNQVNETKKIPLSISNYAIEEVVVTPLSAEEIIKRSRERSNENHFSEGSMQPGFTRAIFYESGELLQVSEAVYNLYHYREKGSPEQAIRPVKGRSVIDSSKYKHINNVMNRKKDTVVLDPLLFLSFGQTFLVGAESDEEENDKIRTEYELNGVIDYEGREVYELSLQSSYKGRPTLAGTVLIDKENYGYHAVEISSVNEEKLHKIVPFAVRALMTLMGFHIRFEAIEAKAYYRYTGEKYYLDKGVSTIAVNVKKGGEWLNGRITQEFYLSERRPSIPSTPPKRDWGISAEIVQDFKPGFFKRYFHLQTTEGMHELVDQLQEKNNAYDGTIVSDRHERWLERKQ